MATVEAHPRPLPAGILSLWCALLLIGVGHWLYLFHAGTGDFKASLSLRSPDLAAHDWPHAFAYASVWQQAVVEWTVPWHVATAMQHTDRFLGNGEVLLSPQVLLLRWLSVQQFLLVNHLLLYLVGFAGCFVLARRLRLSALATVASYLLFHFNGHVVAHLAVGHTMWGAYYLLPWLVWTLHGLESPGAGRKDAVRVALVLALVLLQGGAQIYGACALLLVASLVLGTTPRLPTLGALLSSAALAAVRVLPGTVAHFGDPRTFESGYPTLRILLRALTEVRAPVEVRPTGLAGELSWWEYDAFVGIPGLALLVGFGVLPQASARVRAYLALQRGSAFLLPAAVVALLSMGAFYAPVTALPIPLFSSLRVPSRFLVVPLVLTIFWAAAAGDLWLRRQRRGGVRLLAWLLVVQIGVELAHHSVVWRLGEVGRVSTHADLLDPARIQHAVRLVTRDDPVYAAAVYSGAGISLVTAAVALGLLLRRRVEPVSDRSGPCPA